ncbi:amino acid ABC transporter substrate-binding protein [Aquabacter sp. L1I39]|uniref:amino acid ABC transporter substrate-binding protein n=1 Tax=Aquabacter sp. L1I39 TaxID=2820278 RepID=UPI001AD99DF0|nr:amino acid ABC transporter substrate-binding protein [Aquabacter sp. L1I39]QTL04696.1 amino acid ABC transporter substrate-binding protein [Aquabacter sp. L1I39]
MSALSRRGLLAAALLVGLSSASLAADPVKIGIALSMTGNLADSADHYRKAIELWRDQVNARGGLLGRPVELVIYDERSDPATAARLYEKLITDDKVDLLVAPWGSASTATASAVAEKHKRVIINAGGASEKIQQRGFRYTVQSASPISAYVEGVAPLMTKHGAKTFTMVSRDFNAARDMATELDKVVKNGTLTMVASEYFPAGTSDYSSAIAKARQQAPDSWISIAYPNEAIEMIKQFRANNYMPKMFISNGVSQEDFIKSTGKDGEFAIGISLYEPGVKTKGNPEFVKAFEAKYGYAPGYYAGFGYSGVTVLEEAVKRAGTLDQDKLRATLGEMEIDTVLGHYKVDPKTGAQLGAKGLLIQVLNGKREIVWPEELKTADAVVPMPAWDKR